MAFESNYIIFKYPKTIINPQKRESFFFFFQKHNKDLFIIWLFPVKFSLLQQTYPHHYFFPKIEPNKKPNNVFPKEFNIFTKEFKRILLAKRLAKGVFEFPKKFFSPPKLFCD